MSLRSTRSEPLLLHNTMRITQGHLDEYKQAVTRAVEFVEQHGPQLMVQVFIDDDQLVAHSFQLYPDSAAILRHWKLSDPYIHEVMRHCTVERLEMYGEPDQTVSQGLAPVSTDGVPRVTVPRHIGFLRTPDIATPGVGPDASNEAPGSAAMSGNSGSSTAVSVLGIGAIGGKVAEALLAAGTPVTVWNRTPGPTDALVGRGASGAGSAAAAAAASPLVILCLTNYAAVDEILDAISDSITGRTIVTLTTGSPTEARHAAGKAGQGGASYLDGGVQTEPEAIGTAAATFLYSGPRTAFDEHRATLETIGSARYLGADPAAAAVQDLTLFGLWYDAQIGYLRALQTIRSAGIDVEDFAPVAATQLGHVVHATADIAHEVKTSSFPRGPADLTEHAPVLERLIELRRNQSLGSGDLDCIHQLVLQRIELGHRHDGLTSILE